jgi:hypothetical protein
LMTLTSAILTSAFSGQFMAFMRLRSWQFAPYAAASS